MADAGIKPGKGYVLVKLLESAEPKAGEQQSQSPDAPDEGVLAQVIAAGAETSVKAGQSVIMRPCAARNGLKFSGMVFVDSYAIVATVA